VREPRYSTAQPIAITAAASSAVQPQPQAEARIASTAATCSSTLAATPQRRPRSPQIQLTIGMPIVATTQPSSAPRASQVIDAQAATRFWVRKSITGNLSGREE
jgi:hypothetical protein